MLASMSSVLLESPAMSKEVKDKGTVRLTAVMLPDERHRLRVYSIRVGVPLEKLAALWLLQRLATEEPKLDDAKRSRPRPK